MNAPSPKPALVTQRGARRLPRLPLLLLCLAYIVPGVLGRDPWRNADLAAFGQMAAMAEGRTSWWTPTLGGVPADTALLPHWLGAAFIRAGAGWVDPALAARVPFALLLALTLVLVWYTTFHLARTDSAQPVPFAFGGEASPVDYARAIADGAVLALIATLGLLRLGHETTPELAQLAAISLYLYGLASAPYRVAASRAALFASLPLLAGSGAPSVAIVAGLAGLIVCARSRYAPARASVIWIALAMAAAAALAEWLGAWRWRALPMSADDAGGFIELWLWFTWPAWPLALWTLWRWRRQLAHRHLAVPLVVAGSGVFASVAMAGSDRALMLALPGLAVLAAFALPTFKRSASAAIDWFSMCFFTLFALAVWWVYFALQTGWPAWQAAVGPRLIPGYEARFSMLALLPALLGTAAWFWLLRWRTGRHREALWKSLVLPAGGVALGWLLAMTLLLSALDYARSPRPLMARMAPWLPRGACVAAPGLAPAEVAAMEYVGAWHVDARADAESGGCPYLLHRSAARSKGEAPAGWRLIASVQRPTVRDDWFLIYRRR
ncbi:MAG: hypothetical protein KGN16_00660 [Burkholderiales bacterium]|nr:hypothetical protein [Burkholderiales bacterium]